ncbi:PREDICTED: abnormal spindle-like microcephaly-associated protein homolog [Elephantulus edwardii]|uniref:abnormal spindle-like microcephaly-associated protein homolog n=1 Tax=Elephantulus edwardii TaxID=28737 RepID=UPI0003F0940D|nr:PREDICTED: abnormal spindle-like microcephaly-associated protein homolog [Elephantulus edwardii]
MATWSGGRSFWELSPGDQRTPKGLRGLRTKEEAASPPVLSLSHFCKSPFLCFGNVRVGASRTLSLTLDNPNEEVAVVKVCRFPAADRGFSISPCSFELQPKGKLVTSVNWTPLKEGRVREIVTFLVNDILKHQAILLGNAEEQKKKKRSLWNAINKKTASSASGHNTKILSSRNVNKTFSVSRKVDTVRSPLQACENLTMTEVCSSTENNSLILEENIISISPISPSLQDCHGETCSSISLRRSTTYSSVHSSENVELLQVDNSTISKDFHFNDQGITGTSFNSISIIKDQVEENNRLVLTPSSSSSLNITQSKGNFLSPDSFLENSQIGNNEVELATCVLLDKFMKNNTKPMHLESKTVHAIYQTTLSPESFVNDNYGLRQDLTSESVKPILSPDQFGKDSMVYKYTSQQGCKLSTLSNENCHASQPPEVWRKNKGLKCTHRYQSSESPKAILEQPKVMEIKSNDCNFTKQNHPTFSTVQDISRYNCNKQAKRRPILSATVTKMKPSSARGQQTESDKPKAKRCLDNAIGEIEKGIEDNPKEKEPFHLGLPVIDPTVNKFKDHQNEITPSSLKTTLVARKRKSTRNMENVNEKAAVTEHAEAQKMKRIPFSAGDFKTSTAKKAKKALTPISKHNCTREKLKMKKKPDSVIHKTSGPKTCKRKKSFVPVAQSNLTFIKPLKTNIPRHPMPFAAKNMFYDERWKEKQEQGFTWWLNFILTPDDFTVKTSFSEVNATTLLLGMESQQKISVPRAPTKDEVSLRAYTARCRLNRLRRTSCRLFTSEKLVKAIKKLEIEIEARRIIVRRDRHLWKDVGERQKILNWLLSYNPLWLRIGLETVFGELISLEDNSDVTGLAMFILNRLLWNPDIAAEYRHPTVPHLYRNGHEEALSKFTLKKLLLLVCFLDYAKISRLIDHDPCLFCKDAEFKNFFTARRTMELLTQNWNLSKKLRIPAISRLQKIHNVDIVFEILKSRGIQLTDEHGNTILSKDIVDRHREKTLALLWKIAFAFQVDISLNLDQLKEEIDFLKQTKSIKKALSALSCHSDIVTNKREDKRNSGLSEQYSESIKLLMDWVNAVCAFYNKKVENFTVSFSDGRVLCYLIHHYHPSYVPFEAICQRTTQTVECTQTGSVVLNSSSESDASFLNMSPKASDLEETSELYKELLENEKKNFQLVNSAVRDLGGIPAMIHHSDMSNTIPDEKVVITYLSFLCARLLDLRKEIRAARLIQTTWRRYKLKMDLQRYQERDKAARIIQSAIINFLTKRRLKREVNAALIIQKYWRRFLAQRKLLMLKKEKLEKIENHSASVIQGYWRRYSTRKRFLKLKHYSIILQSRIRMIIAVTSYKRYRWATLVIQRHWRANFRRKQDQQRYKMLKSSTLKIQLMFRRWRQQKIQLQTKAAVILQRTFREWQARKRAKEEKSAIVIQSWYRMHKELRNYTHIRSCVVLIQRRFRCFQIQKLYKKKKESILTIQKYYRAYLKGKNERTQYLQKRAAAIQLQVAFRRMKARDQQRQNRAACVLQSYWRMKREQLRFANLKKMVIKLQAHIRKYQQLQRYHKMRKAALIIQAHFRAYISAKKILASYQKARSAVIVLQSAYRGMQARKKFIRILTAVVKIQSYYRAYIAHKNFMTLKNAAIKLQSIVKMKQTRRYFLKLKEAALCIQHRYRSKKLAAVKREEYLQLQKSCVRLQAYVRGYLVRKQIKLQRRAAISLQSYFRMRKIRQNYLKIYKATLVIQNYYHANKAQVNQRKHFLQVKKAATCLQAAYRGYKVRQLIKQQSTAALKIQTAFRGYSKRMKYQSVLQSTIKIQRWYRIYKPVYNARTLFLKTRAAVILLQSIYRGWTVRRQIRREHNAAVKIQSAFRKSQAQKQFRSLKRAALVIQQHLRAITTGKKQRMEYIELRRATLMLQAAWKGRRVRRQIQRQHKCAVTIQSHYRMHVQQKKWRAIKKAVLLIQMEYRAYRIGHKQRHLYLKTKVAIVTLQSVYRGVKVRKKLRENNKAAVTIQSKYKAYKAQKTYASQRASAITIQRWYRASKIAKQQYRDYCKLKNAAIKIQAVYRGARVRRHIQHMHMAATFMKAMFKMRQSKVRYHAMRRAAIVIQVKYRAYCQGKIQRAKYLSILRAVNIIQARFRGLKVRQTLRKMHTAATLIQTQYRRYREQKYFSELKKITKTVQNRYRAVKARNVQFERYNKLKHSTICIQAAFRGMKARRDLKIRHLAATLIQRKFRTLMMRRRFLSLKKTAIWVQRRYRTNVRARHSSQQFLEKDAIKTQSLNRRLMVKKEKQDMHRAAALIQATFRMHRMYVRYQTYKRASVLIQQHYRAYRAAKLSRENSIRQQNSAVAIHTAYEGMKASQLLWEEHRAAVIIQSTYRMYRQYSFYQRVQWATKVTQGRYRANKNKNKALQASVVMKETTCSQEVLQGMNFGKQIQREHQAATVIQKYFKAFKERRYYLQLREAAVFAQRRYRAHMAVQMRTQSVICAQFCYRAFEVQGDVQKMHLAATQIQSFYRMHRARTVYNARKTAVIIIQNYYRSYIRMKSERSRFLALLQSARTIQAAFRGMKVQQKSKHLSEKETAAIVPQSAFHCYKTKTHYEAAQHAAVRIQTWYKAALIARSQKAEYLSQRKAAVTIQRAFRKMVRRKLERQKCAALRIQSFLHMAVYQRRFYQQKRAVITLQQYFRTWQARKRFLLYRKAALVLQHYYRAFLCARHQRQVYLQIRISVIIIQARVRGFLQRQKFQKIKDSAIKIQAVWKRYKTRKSIHKMKAACKIQAWYRCCRARKDYLAVLKAVKIIQGCFYTKLQRRRFLNMRASTVIIQRRWRAVLSGRLIQDHFLMIKRHQAACLIQANFRGYKERQLFLQQKSAALIIQRHLRARKAGKCERIRYAALKKSTVVLQAMTRGWLVRKRISEYKGRIRLLHFTAAAYYHLSALRIQRAYKRHLALNNAKKHITSVISIQRWFRARLQRKRFIQKYQSIIKTQHEVQQCLDQQNRAALVIQKAARRYLLCRKQEKINLGITKIQALWRGYVWRKKNDSKKIKDIRLSLQMVNRDIREENKLYKRTALALHYLLTYKHLSGILEALKHLEVVTRLSPRCCENMSQSGAISKIFVLIRSCNRSVPCMEVIRYAVQVLLNVAKYEKTTSAVYDVENCIDTLLALLQIYREKAGDKVADKGGSIFTKTCCLLALLLKTRSRASDVRRRSKVVDRIYNIYKLTAHKHKMNAERILYKQKKNSSTNIPFIPETPVRTRVVSRLKPDWLLRRDSLEEITNPLQAIQMVMDTLGIPY